MTSATVTEKLAHLEFRVFRELQRLAFAEKIVLIGCSGGADSVALVHVLAAVAKRLQLNLFIASVHHGTHADAAIARARLDAQKLVADQAEMLRLPFLALGDPLRPSDGDGEAELRRIRRDALTLAAQRVGASAIALAHHRADLLETRLIRLIRGTGSQGLRAMSTLQPLREQREISILRPFLNISRAEIRSYAAAAGLRWNEDPTNLDTGPLRNWLRQVWLPELEAKRAGGSLGLARSLELLARGVPLAPAASPEVEFALDVFLAETVHDQQARIAQILYRHRSQHYSQAHVQEICKRLAQARAPHSTRMFVVGGCQWRVRKSPLHRWCVNMEPLSTPPAGPV